MVIGRKALPIPRKSVLIEPLMHKIAFYLKCDQALYPCTSILENVLVIRLPKYLNIIGEFGRFVQ